MEIKKATQDFLVEELIKPLRNTGKFWIYKLQKENLSTQFALSLISIQNKIDVKKIGFAGLKDKRAITTQYISAPHPLRFTHEKASLEFTGMDIEAMFIGRLIGNKFTIRVTDVTRYTPKTHMVNYFGEQRFSTSNVQIGRLLVNQKFEQALKLILDCDEKGLDQVRAVENNPVNALRQIPKHMLQFYIHAFQSYMWNKAVSVSFTGKKDEAIYAVIPEHIENSKEKLPLIGFDYDQDHEILNNILEEENLTARSFIISSFRELTCEGGQRNIIVPISELSCKREGVEYVVSFILPKGSYATVALRHLFE